MDKVLSATCISFLAMAASANAATFNFSSAPAVQGPSLSSTSGSVTATITGYSYTPNGTVGAALVLGAQADVHIDNQGLGVCDDLSPSADMLVSCRQPLVDAIENNGGPEVVLFSFSRAINVTKVIFNQNDMNDDVDIFGGTPLGLVLRDTTSLTGGPTGDVIDVSAFLKGVTSFAVGIFDQGSNDNNSDQVRIAGIEFELAPIPVPAAGFLLIGALGGLAALRRRRGV